MGSLFGGIRRTLRVGVWRRELDDELAFHFEHTVEELMEQGRSRSEAEAEAERRFGDVRGYRRSLETIDRGREIRRRWRIRIGTLRDSVGQALRTLKKSPGFATAIILTFALGIGANATIFSILDRLLLSPPPGIENAGELRRLMVERRGRNARTGEYGERITTPFISYPDYQALAGAGAFAAAAGIASRDLTVGEGMEAATRPTQFVSGSYFTLLGARPSIGRLIVPADDGPDAMPVAVISYGLWQQMHGGRADALGRTIRAGRITYTIVGVAAEGFSGIDTGRTDLWLPIEVAAEAESPECFSSTRCVWMEAVARLKPSASVGAAVAEATTLYRREAADRMAAGQLDPESAVVATPLIAGRGPTATSESRVTLWLAGTSLMVLLIACANIANLLLARSIGRRREIGVRLAMGSSTRRLAGEMAAESLVLSGIGGLAALVASIWFAEPLRRVLMPELVWGATTDIARTAGVVALLSIVAGFAAVALPALYATRLVVNEVLKGPAAGSRARTPRRLQAVLGILQTAASIVLLIGAGLFLRSLERAATSDLGFDLTDVYLAEPDFADGMPAGGVAAFYRAATERLEASGLISDVSPDRSVPLRALQIARLQTPGGDVVPLPAPPSFHTVGPGYFRLLGLDIREGRAFTAADAGQPVAIISETIAREFFPAGDAVGECVVLPERGGCLRVVGVVEETTWRYGNDIMSQAYLPFGTMAADYPPMGLLFRFRNPANPAVADVRRILFDVDPSVRFVEIRGMETLLDPQLRGWRLGATLFSIFGVLALLVAAIGLYSLLAFGVAQRVAELGIRSALGATRARLFGMVVSEGLQIAATGTVAGLLLAWLAAPRMADLLFETSPHNVAVFAGGAALLLAVAVAAGTLPGRRAVGIEPRDALREH